MFKYYDILIAMAERAKVSETPWDIVQFKSTRMEEWETMETMPAFSSTSEYRLKPKPKVKYHRYDFLTVDTKELCGAVYVKDGDLVKPPYSLLRNSIDYFYAKTNIFIEVDE